MEEILKDISERAANGNFNYSRFFAVGLFRLLELANATEPTILEKVSPLTSCISQLNGIFKPNFLNNVYSFKIFTARSWLIEKKKKRIGRALILLFFRPKILNLLVSVDL